MQNPHQQDIKCGWVYACAGGLSILNLTKTLLIYGVSYVKSVGMELCLGAMPPKSPRRNGTASMCSRNRVLIIVEYSPSCSWMEYCYSSFSLRQEFFKRLGQSIVFGHPGWRSCGNVKKSAQQVCLGAGLQQTTSQSLNQHGKVMCVPIRQRVQLLRSQ